MKIYVISLGCQKNKVDSEVLLGNILTSERFSITNDYKKADIIMINTCAFIEPAKQEAIDTILWAVDNKKKGAKILVCGCLSTRYESEIKELLPEVDCFVSIKDYPKLKNIVNELVSKDYLTGEFDINNRIITGSKFSVDVKISEGCNNKCSYCAIPLIRGEFVSRDKESIIKEVKDLAKMGVKEINLISQDTTNYGYGLYKDYGLVELLEDLVKIEGNFKLRLLYLYPALVSDKLIDFIANSDKVMPYFDIPIQHSENRMLALMNRRDNKEKIINLVERIRRKIPNAILRTTLIVGFPTETEEEYLSLVKFVKEMEFDRLGAFSYSAEEGTKGYEMDGQIAEEVKQERLQGIYLAQDEVAIKRNKLHVGEVMDVLVEEYLPEEYCFKGRSYAFAPDDIDGAIYFYDEKGVEPKVGEVVKVKIIDADINTLTGLIEGE